MSGGNGNSEAVILATAGYDHTIRFWQAHSGICCRTAQHPDSKISGKKVVSITTSLKNSVEGLHKELPQVNAMEITPDRQLLAAAGYQHIRMYDISSANPNPVVNYDGVSKNVTAVGFHEDGKWMFTGGEDSSARIWDLRSRNLQCQRVFQVNAPVNCVCLHPNQGELIVGDQSGAIHMWDLRTDHNEQLIPDENASVLSISIDREASYMAAVNNKGNCYVWSLSGGTNEDPTVLHPKTKIESHERYALKCQFSPDSCLLATTSADQTVKIWQTADFSLKTTLKDATQRWVWDCAFSEDSQYLVTASSDNIARLWNIDAAEVVREYKGHQKAVVSLAFRDAQVN